LSVPRHATTIVCELASYPTKPLIFVAVLSTTVTSVRWGVDLHRAQFQFWIWVLVQWVITEYFACRMAYFSL
jgi:hypothetical protein